MPRRAYSVMGLLLAVATLATAGPRLWQWWDTPPPGICTFCLRPEHLESMVEVKVRGEGVRHACCLSCALTYQRQSGKTLRVASVTEHESQRPIDPTGAVFVVGSDVTPCTHDVPRAGEAQGKPAIRWDRCLPSILAFASREAAATFQGEHGGTVRTLAELQGPADARGQPRS